MITQQAPNHLPKGRPVTGAVSTQARATRTSTHSTDHEQGQRANPCRGWADPTYHKVGDIHI